MLNVDKLMVFYENMLALNNVSLACGLNQIVGVFGANSAGCGTFGILFSNKLSCH